MKLPTIIKDTREKADHGFNFIASKNCAGMVVEKLDFGDYAIKDHLGVIVIERKASVTELCNNIGKYRDRFIKELERMVEAGVKRKYIVIEDHYSAIFRQRYTKMHPNSIFESIMGLQVEYDIPFLFASNKKNAQRVTRSLLLKAYKYHCEGRI